MSSSEEWSSGPHVHSYLDRANSDARPVSSDEALLEHVPSGARRILDLGTGDGRLAALLLQGRPDRQVVGLDLSELMLAAAEQRFAGDSRVELLQHDLTVALPDIGCFDAVVSSLAIHHLPDARKRSLYAEAFEMLEPGGVLANFEHVASPSRRLHLEFFAAIEEPLEHEDPSDRLVDVETQLQWLRAIGFEEVDCHWKWRELALLAGVRPRARAHAAAAAGAPGSRPTAEAWEEHAQAWARWTRTPGHDHHYEHLNLPAFLALLPEPGRLTLDLGCGEGRLGRALADRGHVVIGVDSSPTLAALARAGGGYREVLEAPAAAVPLPDGCADLVVAFMTLHDMDELAAPVAEAARLLGPAGQLCLAVPHPFAEFSRGRPGDSNYFVAHRYVDVLERDGVSMTFESWRRPLSAYTTALAHAGLQIDSLREPIPDDAGLAAAPALARWRESPIFLHVRAVRQAEAANRIR